MHSIWIEVVIVSGKSVDTPLVTTQLILLVRKCNSISTYISSCRLRLSSLLLDTKFNQLACARQPQAQVLESLRVVVQAL